MNIGQAKAVARQWVFEQGCLLDGYQGAFFHGSVNWMSDDATLPQGSDFDAMIVLEDTDLPTKIGKFTYQHVLLEISYISADQLQIPEQVLGQCALAGSFSVPSIIDDPTGHLTQLQVAVARDYARREWVNRRCEQAQDKVVSGLNSITDWESFYDQVNGWLFSTGVTTHILLVAGLRNPTVRRRYVAVRDLLKAHDRLDFHDRLLGLLGCENMGVTQVRKHLKSMTAAFDAAKDIDTPYFFASDISEVSRPIAIDGTEAMIDTGHHRDAVFWILATFNRSLIILEHDRQESAIAELMPDYQRLLANLGITGLSDVLQKAEQTRNLLPEIWEVAESIINVHPEITD